MGAFDWLTNGFRQVGDWFQQNVAKPVGEWWNTNKDAIGRGAAKAGQILGNAAYDIGKSIPGVGAVLTGLQPAVDAINRKVDEYTGTRDPSFRQDVSKGLANAYQANQANKRARTK